MSKPAGGFCSRCGEKLEPHHRFCWKCGQARPAPAPPPAGEAADPGGDLRTVRWLVWLFAAGAIYWLVQLTVSLAYALAPNGSHSIAVQLAAQGAPASWATSFVITEIAVSALAAAVHAIVYSGLRRRRLWGWISAVVVSCLYSLVLVGIPALYLLLRRGTRTAFGVH